MDSKLQQLATRQRSRARVSAYLAAAEGFAAGCFVLLYVLYGRDLMTGGVSNGLWVCAAALAMLCGLELGTAAIHDAKAKRCEDLDRHHHEKERLTQYFVDAAEAALRWKALADERGRLLAELTAAKSAGEMGSDQ